MNNHPITAFEIRFLDEPERPPVPLAERMVRIGAGPDNHIRLSAPGVLDNHAFLIFRTGAYHFRNLGDARSALCNGNAVDSLVTVQAGDILSIGPTRLGVCGPQGTGPVKTDSDILETLDQSSVRRLFADMVSTVSTLVRDNDRRRAAADLVAVVARVLRCDGARLVLKQAQTLQTIALLPAGAPEDRFSRTAVKWAEKESRTILAADIDQNSLLPLEESTVIKDIRSVLCSPLTDESGKTLGFLYLDRLKGNAPFSEKDAEIFERLRLLFSALFANANEKESQAESIRVLAESAHARGAGGLIYESCAMAEVVEQSLKVSASDVPILIQGQTGTGKEVLAQMIHRASPRKNGPCIAVNCGAIPAELMESEFFGHRKGAFTGAVNDKKGHMEAAHGGTLFLDEISELPIALQVKLLRAVQQNEIVPVGSSTPVPIDIRIVSASNKNLAAEVAAGRFRQDLYYRLTVVCLDLPALVNRDRDAVLLAHHFLKQYSLLYGTGPRTLSAAAEKAILAYSWPGNVRELINRIQKAMILSQKPAIDADDLGLPDREAMPANAECLTMEIAREQAERDAINRALAKSGGNVSLCARLLDVDRKVLIRLLQKLAIDARTYK
jgi:DNA-binding NtrC family response regulator/pSer/pThr/pTyr-binding forkhead associated (FHA) protein